MKRLLLLIVVLLTCTSTGVVHAGWHHRCCWGGQSGYSMPGYYPAQATYAVQGTYALPAAPQSGLGDVIITRLIEQLIGNMGRVLPPPTNGRPTIETGVDLSAVRQDLAALRGDVGALAERVENASSTLQRAGESLVAIQQDLRELRGEIDETTEFRSELAKIRDVVAKLNLTDQARAELRAKLLSDLEYEGKLKDAVEGKNLDAAKAALKDLVDRVVP